MFYGSVPPVKNGCIGNIPRFLIFKKENGSKKGSKPITLSSLSYFYSYPIPPNGIQAELVPFWSFTKLHIQKKKKKKMLQKTLFYIANCFLYFPPMMQFHIIRILKIIRIILFDRNYKGIFLCSP